MEERCWICRRNQKDLEVDFKEYMDDSGMPYDEVLLEQDLGGQKVFLCQGCIAVLFHHLRNEDNGLVDELTFVQMGDLAGLVEHLKKALDEWLKE